MKRIQNSARSAPQNEFLIHERELARRLGGVGRSTLRRWRQDGSGPPFRRLGGKLIRYDWREVAAWLDQQAPQVKSTTEADALARKLSKKPEAHAVR